MSDDQLTALTRRILIVNDDGVQSRGIALLERVARSFGGEVIVVAPDEERSGAGQSICRVEPACGGSGVVRKGLCP